MQPKTPHVYRMLKGKCRNLNETIQGLITAGNILSFELKLSFHSLGFTNKEQVLTAIISDFFVNNIKKFFIIQIIIYISLNQ